MFSLSNEDDEGAFGNPLGGGSSKLANLFGHDKASFTGGNESLKYTAPKQPRKDKSGTGDAPAVVFASAVHAYKYVDGQHVNQGKLGAAVLANHTTNDYKILLYAAKQQQVAISRIHSQFAYTVQDNNYASFCDDQRQIWSICFDSDKNAVLFAKQVGLAVFNTQPSTLVTQDLLLGDVQAVELGDAVEVKYSGWLWTNNAFGKVFDSNADTDKTFRFKTGKGKVIKGWDQGVIGMKKGGKRLIAIPPALAYGEQGCGGGRVPPNAALLFEVDVLRIKSKDSTDSGGSKGSSRTESPTTIATEPKDTPQIAPLPNITGEPSGVKKRSDSSASIKGRTASISEQLSQSPGKNSDKARLLARMSKMGGKSVLAGTGAVSGGVEDDDEEEQIMTDDLTTEDETAQVNPVSPTSPTPKHQSTPQHTHANPKPNPPTKPHLPQRPAPVQPHPEVQQIPPAQPMGVSYTSPQQLALYQNPQAGMPMNYPMMQQPPQYYQQPPFPVHAYPPPPPPAPPQAAPTQPSANDAMVPVLMAETRQQQSEVRMAIGKATDKIDELHHKVDRLQQGSGALVPSSAIPGMSANTSTVMEASVLLHNITRIVQENEKLKTDNGEKSNKIDTLNEKISDLLQKNQRFLEKSNVMMEQSSDSLQHNSAQSQARVIALEQEKISHTAEFTELKTRLNEAEAHVAALRKQEAELKSQANRASSSATKYQEELDHVKELHEEKSSEAAKLKQDLKEERQTRKRVESRADHMDEELSDLRHEKESLEKSITDRKRKHTQDRRKFEEEFEELKNQHEDDLQTLKERHRREKKSGDVTASQIAQVESDIEARWTDKAAKMVAQGKQKWQRKYDELVEEKEELSSKLASLGEKHSGLVSWEGEKEEQLKHLQSRIDDLTAEQEKITSTKDEKDKEIHKLKETIEQLEGFESKYQDIRTKTFKMKEEYENQLSAAEEGHEEALSASYKKGLDEGRRQGGGAQNTTTTENLANEVKKIMNNVFYMLREEFDANSDYTGAQIMSVVLTVVKEVTLKHVSTKSDEGVDEEDDDDEEEEDDEDDEEEEEEEEEEDEEIEDKVEENEEKEVEDEENDEEEVEEAKGEDEEVEDKVEEKEEKDDKEEEEEKGEHEEEEQKGNEERSEHEEGGEEEEKKDEPERVKVEQPPSSSTVDQENESEAHQISTPRGPDDMSHASEVTDLPEEHDSSESTKLELADHSDEKSNENQAPEEDIAQTNDDDTSLQNTKTEETQINKTIDETSSVQQPTHVAYSEDSESDTEGPPPLDEDNANHESQQFRSDTDGKDGEKPDKDAANIPQATSDETKNQTQKEEIASRKFPSLFADDGHDDVTATFGPMSKRTDPSDESPSKPVPPPLFDDDEDDDIDWFK